MIKTGCSSSLWTFCFRGSKVNPRLYMFDRIIILWQFLRWIWASQVALVVKNSPANSGDPGSIPGSGRCPGEENGYPLQSCCLENLIDRGAWWAIVHGVTRVGHDWATEYAWWLYRMSLAIIESNMVINTKVWRPSYYPFTDTELPCDFFHK